MEIIAMGALGGDTGPVTNSYTLLDIDLVADNYADALSKMLTKIGGIIYHLGRVEVLAIILFIQT